ncbi:hypothetical protein J3458_012833 [Metarhizium acridum]|uniref:uncharacterized protein n=1 Tax=Metarhizium acridum TaxID=92637 RepID=UPI001C6C1E82|nr:hypothetical protein J3458_012833 [Metarhizium acridum]
MHMTKYDASQLKANMKYGQCFANRQKDTRLLYEPINLYFVKCHALVAIRAPLDQPCIPPQTLEKRYFYHKRLPAQMSAKSEMRQRCCQQYHWVLLEPDRGDVFSSYDMSRQEGSNRGRRNELGHALVWTPSPFSLLVSLLVLFHSQLHLSTCDVLSSTPSSVASAAPYCKTDIFSGGPDIDGYSLFICDSDTKADTIYRYTTARSRADNAMTLDSITTFIPSSTSHRQSKTTISGVYTGSGIPITRSSLYISSERGLWSTSVITATKNPSTSMTSSGALTKSPAAMVGMVIGSAGLYPPCRKRMLS